MSSEIPTSERAIAQLARVAISGATAALSGRKVRPNTDPVHKHSYDVADRRARPWAKVGNGSREQWNAYRFALLRTLREQLVQDKVDRYREWNRLQANDELVLDALLDHFNHATGELYPAQQTVADKTGLSRRQVVYALARLRSRGFVTWVRRTVKKDGAEGLTGPQREQKSNAYHFDWRRKMAKRTWMRFWQLVSTRLRKLGNVAARALQPPTWRDTAGPALRATLDSLGRAVSPNPPSPEPGAST